MITAKKFCVTLVFKFTNLYLGTQYSIKMHSTNSTVTWSVQLNHTWFWTTSASFDDSLKFKPTITSGHITNMLQLQNAQHKQLNCIRKLKSCKNISLMITRIISECENWGWWTWALLSPDGVVPSRMVGVSASVNLLLHHKVQKFSSGTGPPRWSRKKGR